jgi:hypothetical protein
MQFITGFYQKGGRYKMNGIKLPLTGVTFTDGTLPIVISVDPIETSGSLLLLEPNHPVTQWSSGIPANGGTVPNVLATLGTATAGASVAAVPVQNTSPSSSAMILERTTKGGVHAAVSPTNGTTASIGLLIGLPSALLDYLKANPTHIYYLSMWSRLTKVMSGATSLPTQLVTSTTFQAGLGSVLPTPQATITNSVGNTVTSSSPVDSGPVLRSQNFTGLTSDFTTASDATLATRMGAMDLGNFAAQAGGSSSGKWGGWAMYRVYLEDLTVSGRSNATVAAIDAAQLANAIGAASSAWGSGRYNGDTMPTADSTLT